MLLTSKYFEPQAKENYTIQDVSASLLERPRQMRYMAYDADLDFIDDIVDIDEDFLGGTWENTKKFLPELAGPFKALPVVQHHGATINETGACSQYVADRWLHA